LFNEGVSPQGLTDSMRLDCFEKPSFAKSIMEDLFLFFFKISSKVPSINNNNYYKYLSLQSCKASLIAGVLSESFILNYALVL
jgi:hypothetical protein